MFVVEECEAQAHSIGHLEGLPYPSSIESSSLPQLQGVLVIVPVPMVVPMPV